MPAFTKLKSKRDKKTVTQFFTVTLIIGFVRRSQPFIGTTNEHEWTRINGIEESNLEGRRRFIEPQMNADLHRLVLGFFCVLDLDCESLCDVGAFWS